MKESKGSRRVAEASRCFLDVIDQEGVQPLIQAASEFFGAPVLFTDELFHIRSVWPREQTGVAELDQSIREGAIQAKREWAILDENLSGEKAFYEPFYANTGVCELVPRLYGELVWQDEVRGHVVVYLGQVPCHPEDLEIMQKLISLLVLKLRRRMAGMDRWTATLQARLEVLLDPQTPLQVRRPAEEMLRKQIKGDYGIMVTTIGQRASQKAFADYAVTQIQQRFRNIVVLVYDQTIVTLFGEVKRNAVENTLNPENNALVKWLFRYFAQYDLVSGLSDPFSSLKDIYLHYRRALLTARMVERSKQGTDGIFEDYMPLPMLASVLETEQAETFIHPVLEQIRAYDAGNNTDYFDTLYQYAMHLFEKESTAKALTVHKNTLAYRLGRISELFLLDFSDRRTRLNLILSCCLWYLSHEEESFPLDGVFG